MDKHLASEINVLKEKLGFYAGRLVSYPFVPPEHVYFVLTDRCNLRCKMCGIPKEQASASNELTTAQVKDIIVQINELGIRHLIFSGGDPILREDLAELVDFAKRRGIAMVDIITNGTLLDDEIIVTLIKAGLSHVTVSLDGFKENNDKVRGDGVFKKAEGTIDRLNYYKKIKGSMFPTIGINFTIMEDNVGDILPMIEFARAKRCNVIIFQPILFDNTRMYEKKRNALWPKGETLARFDKIIQRVRVLKSSLDDLVICTGDPVLEAMPAYFRGRRMSGDFKCYEALKRIVITSDGKLWSCVGIYGNLKETNIKNIWFSKEADKIRNKVRRCGKHCLQDCVYFPSDVSEHMRALFNKFDHIADEDKMKAKNILLNSIDGYVSAFRARCSSNDSIFLKLFKCAREISKLDGLKREIRDI